MKNNLNILRTKAIDFMHSQWASDCLGVDELDIDRENFNSIADRIFNSIVEGKKKSFNPMIFRTGGQSGSGKTTQLMPSIQTIINDKKLDFINLAVRNFANFHPHYDELLAEYGSGLIREKTNGFALMMLFRIAELLIQNHYNILFEVTLLDINFEEYLIKLAKENKYTIHLHVLSVPRKKSEEWIEKRKNKSKTEGNRVVLAKSSDLFYNVLPETINSLIEFDLWSDDDQIFLWNGFNFEPVIYGSIHNNQALMNNFNKYRQIEDFDDANEDELLKAKIKWLRSYYEDRI